MKNTLDEINSRINEAEEQISELEDRVVEITATEQNKEKRMKRNEDSLRDLWDNVKCNDILIIGVPEGKEGEKGNSYPSTGSAESPIHDKPKEEHAKTHSNQLTKTKDKEKILKATREKQQIMYKGMPIRDS